MPDDLLSPASILARLREVLTEDVCADVEVIGWLYQFYISEKKDQVFAGLKKNQKITAENIPAATQLFTPHWIVRYLVENSLGRLWLLNRPASKLAAQMDYYIAPEGSEMDFLKISKPEEIKVCDPACGSGHMLTYAFDLLYAIYEEEGYEPTDIPALILAHNLTGVEIDDRAGALAAFALTMKAAARLGRRRFLRMEAKPDICVLQNVAFTPTELQDVAALVGSDLFIGALRETLSQFEQAKNFGSLIMPKLREPAETLRVVKARDFGGDLLLKELQERVVSVLRMAEALSPKYHVVVANPPYAGASGLNDQIKGFGERSYPSTRANLYSMFMERITQLVIKNGLAGLMTPFSWMYISSFEDLRYYLLKNTDFITLVQLDYDAYTDAKAHPCAFAFQVGKRESPSPGIFIGLEGFKGAASQPIKCLEAISNVECKWRYSRHTKFFEKIPNYVIAYTASEKAADAFSRGLLASDFICDGAMKTGNNDRFLRHCWEIEQKARSSNGPWRDHLKGGEYRKWSGNREFVVNWTPESLEFYRSDRIARILDQKYWNLEGVSWSAITSGPPSFRKLKRDDIANNASLCIFPTNGRPPLSYLAYLNSKLGEFFLKFRSQTANILAGDVLSLPINEVTSRDIDDRAERCIALSDIDWDAYETSWDFATLPLLSPNHRGETLKDSYNTLRAHWQSMTDEMKALEEANNSIFIDAYGLQDELVPEVPIEEITLTCNAAYRYGVKGTEVDRETRLRGDTMAEFLSYAVGCMFGRYSLDAPGLILANQSETLADYLARVPQPTFLPDEDNVIPVLEGEWFADDITGRFRKFLRVTFGEAKFQENLAFIEAALGKDVRKWFTRDFFDYHVRRYKKRPIYWMFSSPKGSFNALIYMHRYRPDTVSIVLNDYLRELISKLQAERARLEKLSDDPAASQTQRTRALKDVATVIKQIDELEGWERDVVFPLAQAKLEIDLDDGVKRNYPKFGAAVKPIKGLETADE